MAALVSLPSRSSVIGRFLATVALLQVTRAEAVKVGQIKFCTPLVALQLQLLQRKRIVEPTAAVYTITTAECEYLRPIITKLCMGDGWKLPEVMAEIESKFGFKAT